MNAAGIQATLKSKGQAMTLTRTEQAGYDPVTGAPATGIVTEFTVYGVTKAYGPGVTNKLDSLILAGDKLAIIDSVSAVPVPEDKLTIAGAVWSIITVDAIDPQGTALLYKCQVRK